MNKTTSTHDLQESSVSTEWRDSSTSVCTTFSDSSLLQRAGKADKSGRHLHLAFGSLCFSSEDEAAMAAILADSATTLPSFTFSPSLDFCSDPSLLCSPPPSCRQPPASASSKFCLSAASISTTTSTSTLSNSAPGPWWHRALCVLSVGAKMCVMFALMAVFWVVLALPTIDQHLYTLFCFLCQYWTLSAAQPTLNKEEGSQRPAATHHQVLQIREDGDTSDGEGEGGTAKKPRLNGSQELKKSEEGESVEEVVKRQEGEAGAAASVDTLKPKTKSKRRVRFSDADLA